MDILYLLVPLSVLAMFGVLGVFAWALHGASSTSWNPRASVRCLTPIKSSAEAV